MDEGVGPAEGGLGSGAGMPDELVGCFEQTPLTRSEYISALVHLYRGELYRANAWRIRLDNTTNWAVLTTAGLLTFAFGNANPSHWVLLLGSGLITVFWAFESRRFRFADVWRSRVRKIEENFYGPILRRDLDSPMARWGELVAHDLFQPSFKITRLMALRARLVRNYWAIYLVLFAAWGLHVITKPTPATTWGELRSHLTEGMLSWWVPVGLAGGFLACLMALTIFAPRAAHTSTEEWGDENGAGLDRRNVDL